MHTNQSVCTFFVLCTGFFVILNSHFAVSVEPALIQGCLLYELKHHIKAAKASREIHTTFGKAVAVERIANKRLTLRLIVSPNHLRVDKSRCEQPSVLDYEELLVLVG